MSLSQCLYGRRPGPVPFRPAGECRPVWWSLLTPGWRSLAVPPRSFRVFREYEVPARRVLGYDGAGTPCFCAYDYRLMALRSDDDEDFYQAATYVESLTSWRLRDGRWLVHRRVEPLGDEGEEVVELSIAQQMPR